ncbi:MAG: SGNH/GDSL hydrolase family protein [Bacteroidetes bacterium]|nr:SGNH/GDSL hydrolase family protein [Bacteroidota bacterium]
MGSSTAAGTGASSYANSWAGKIQAYYQQNTTDGIDTVFYNIAIGSYTTYQEMPSDFSTPSGRPSIDASANVNKALSYSPDVIIISLPSNDMANGYSKKEYMNNLRLMYSRIITAGVKCYIASTQPRSTLSTAGRDSLRTLVDSINNNFGLYTIDFWDDLVTTDGLNNLKPTLTSDGIHPNNTGHNYLFIRVRDKNIFQSNLVLPITLTGFSVSAGSNKTDLIKWTTAGEENNIRFEIQRSNDGISFSPVYTENTNISSQQDSFEWTDHESAGSMVYYRLKITEASGRVSYSSIVSIRNNYNNIVLNNIYFDHSAGNLSLQISSDESRTIVLSIINTSGSVITTKKEFISSPGQTVSIPVQSISSGEYFIRVTTDDGQSVTKAFIK